MLVSIRAPDQLGMLWAICRWFADHHVNIESMSATTNAGSAVDTFIVSGEFDTDELAAHIGAVTAGGCLGSLPMLRAVARR